MSISGALTPTRHLRMRLGHRLRVLALAWLLNDRLDASGAAAPGTANAVRAAAEATAAKIASEPPTGESFLARHWTTLHGLPQNTVTCLEQTPDGYLWLGTRYGLVRHDGVRFTVFLAELGEAATDSVDCLKLVADEDGTLWVLTRGGLFACRQGRFERHTPTADGTTPFPVESMAACRSGGLWLGGPRGVGRYHDRRLGPVFEAGNGLRTGAVSEVFEDRAGRLWLQFVVEARRPWQRLDPRNREVRELADIAGADWPKAADRVPYQWETVREDAGGRLWIGSPEELREIDGKRVRRFPAAGFWGGHSVHALQPDRNGNLWIVSEGATPLHRFDGERLTPMTRIGAQVIDPDVRSVLADREGNVWIGSGSAGLYRIQRRQLLSRLQAADSSLDEVYSVFPLPEDGAWLGTHQGVLRVTSRKSEMFHEAGGGPGPRAKPVFADRAGQLWLGVMGAGLSRLDASGKVAGTGIHSPAGSPDWHVRALFQDRARDLWVGASCGLLRLNATSTNWFTTADGLTASTVLGITQTPDGALWLGTDGGGVNILTGDRWRTLRKSDGLLHDRVWPLAVEPDGAVWLGTPLGLNRVRGTEIRSVTTEQGLYDNLAYSLLDDGRGWYWCHCNRGLWRMRKAELAAVADGRESHVFCVNYDETDGLESSEGNGDEQPSAGRLASGELWFPTTRGVVIVDPARLQDNDVRPLTVIESVIADGRELVGRSRPLPPVARPGTPPPALRIAPGQARVLELHYTAPSFLDAERLRFRYRLEGHDDRWQEAGPRRVAYYTALAPGRYRFLVAAGNHYGYWTETPATLDLELEPRFRQTWAFRALVILGLGALLGALHRRRVRYLQQIELLKRRQSVEAERSRIARDLHDDLGAGLAGIGLQVELARTLARGGESTEPLLDRVTESARHLVDQLREVVWALNPACDTLENFVTFVAGFTEDYLARTGVRCRLEVPARFQRLALPTEARHGLMLAVKEALANAIRHGQPGEVRLGVRITDRELQVEVEDDGCGFEVSAVLNRPPTGGGARGGTGLSGLNRRLEGLGGRCRIVSRPGGGTHVTFTLPVASAPS